MLCQTRLADPSWRGKFRFYLFSLHVQRCFTISRYNCNGSQTYCAINITVFLDDIKIVVKNPVDNTHNPSSLNKRTYDMIWNNCKQKENEIEGRFSKFVNIYRYINIGMLITSASSSTIIHHNNYTIQKAKYFICKEQST